MNGIKGLFNWISEHLDSDYLFPKEWALPTDEKNFLKSTGYRVQDVKKTIGASHYAVPPMGFFITQHVFKANGDKLNEADVKQVEEILETYRARNNTPTNTIKPE